MYPFQGFDVVEVWNGLWTLDRPWNADNEAAVAEWGRSLAADIHSGRWRPAIGNSDAHLAIHTTMGGSTSAIQLRPARMPARTASVLSFSASTTVCGMPIWPSWKATLWTIHRSQ